MAEKFNSAAFLRITLIALLSCVLCAAFFFSFSVQSKICEGVYIGAYVDGLKVSEDVGTVYYNADGELVLDGADITDTYSGTAKAGVYFDGDLTIVLNGENSITVSDVDDDKAGIYVDGDLTVKGSGSLTIAVSNALEGATKLTYGIYCESFVLDGGSLIISADDSNDDVYGVYTAGGGLFFNEGDAEISVPDNQYVLYNDITGSALTLGDGKGFKTLCGGDAADTAADLLASDGTANVNELQTGEYPYICFSVRTKYTVKHYVMDTLGGYSVCHTEKAYGKEGETLTLSGLKNTAYETYGISYGNAKVSGADATTAAVKADGSLSVSLYYVRTQSKVSKGEGAGTGFSLDCGENAYAGATVTVSDYSIDPDRYKDLAITVTQSNGYAVDDFDYDLGTFTMPAMPVTVVSSATPKTYTVTLNLGGGTLSGTGVSEYTFGSSVVLPTTIKKDNSEFAGWYASSDFSGAAVTDLTSSDYGDKSFYAKWNIHALAADESGASLYVEGGFEQGSAFTLTVTKAEDYDYSVHAFNAQLTSSEDIAAVYSLSLTKGGVSYGADGVYTVKLPVSIGSSQAKLLVLSDGEITPLTANVTDGYAVFTINGLDDFALVIAKTVEPYTSADGEAGDSKPDLLWLYILLPCLAVAGAAVAFVVIKKKKKKN